MKLRGAVIGLSAGLAVVFSASPALAYQEAQLMIQEFVSRGDMPCGTTIGPLVAAGVGMRTVDVGNPMLSMHSARELAGSADPESMTAVLAEFLGAHAPLPW